MKTKSLAIPLLVAFGFMAFLPKTQAVSPAPDGCYPNYTTAEGCNALNFLTTGAGNTGLGWYSLFSNSTGSFSTGVGAGTLVLNNADSNTAVGAAALLLNITGHNNTAVGTDALVYNDTGNFNTAHGAVALLSNTTGNYNTAIGVQALANNTAGHGNIALGESAGVNLTTGNSNIDIGSTGVAGESGTIRIGINAVQSRAFIAGIRGATTGNANAIPVLIDSVGQLGTMSSSRRFKQEIKPMDKASETILSLKPVTFHYKSDSTGAPQFGLIAEEVAEVNPDLVVRDENGEIYTVRYEAVNAMLLNEFLKEHNAFMDQKRKVEKLEATVADLVATVKKQPAQIQ